VAQRVSTIIDADNILVLHEGKIVGQGKHQKLLRTCDIYREIVYSQLDPEEIDKTLALSHQVLANEGAD
jgi:ATP-binding cassette subfamily B protein